jgi:hypothetical protein
MEDLFLTPEKLPDTVNNLIKNFQNSVDVGADRYAECEKLAASLKQEGYTFDYGLDGEPFNLQKIEL